MPAIGQLIRQTEQRLAKAGIGDAPIEADLIWMTALELDRAQLYARMRDEPSADERRRASDLIERRLRHEPAAYLMGHREFYGIDLLAGLGVLIPRPDTEALVEEALRIARSRPGSITIADVGCGTGAIGIALAANLPNATVYAMDLYDPALEIARRNIERCGLSERIEIIKSDLLDELREPVDIIAGNLPYVRTDEIPTLDPEIRMYEPREALDGGDDGLDIIRRLISSAPAYLKPGGVILMEMDPRQVAAASAFAAATIPWAKLHVVQDLARRDRVLVVQA